MKHFLLILALATAALAQTKPQAAQLKAPSALGPRVLVFLPGGGAQLATFDNTITLNNGVLSCPTQPFSLTFKTATGAPDASGQWMLPAVPSQVLVLARNGVLMSPGVDYTISGATIQISSSQGFASDDTLLSVYLP